MEEDARKEETKNKKRGECNVQGQGVIRNVGGKRGKRVMRL